MDQRAAQEMVNLTRQNGVPVTVIDGQAIIGFDQAQLEQALSTQKRSSLGVAVADASKITQRKGAAVTFGAYVGKVHADSAAARLGLTPGDIIIEINMGPIANATDVEKVVTKLSNGSRISVAFLRGTKRLVGEGLL
jgi:S1-C subfamily serine protease